MSCLWDLLVAIFLSFPFVFHSVFMFGAFEVDTRFGWEVSLPMVAMMCGRVLVVALFLGCRGRVPTVELLIARTYSTMCFLWSHVWRVERAYIGEPVALPRKVSATSLRRPVVASSATLPVPSRRRPRTKKRVQTVRYQGYSSGGRVFFDGSGNGRGQGQSAATPRVNGLGNKSTKGPRGNKSRNVMAEPRKRGLTHGGGYGGSDATCRLSLFHSHSPDTSRSLPGTGK